MSSRQAAIDTANAEFWDELCGSAAARAWGITDQSMASLRRFDDNFQKYYPYLDRHIPWPELRRKRVLEVGLGYGAMSQKIAEAGAYYYGLDIARGPIDMVRYRLQQSQIAGDVRQGSILAPNYEPATFDVVVAIGTLHHTGDMKAAIASCRRLLKPGGRLIGMVYYAYSFRRWWTEPASTRRYLLRECSGYRGSISDGETSAYDHSAAGALAPSTEFISVKSLRSYCRDFTDFSARLENINQEPPLMRWTRDRLLATPLPRICGLDLYWSCAK